MGRGGCGQVSNGPCLPEKVGNLEEPVPVPATGTCYVNEDGSAFPSITGIDHHT